MGQAPSSELRPFSVNFNSCKLQGKTVLEDDKPLSHVFNGIPYAKAGRFEKPVPLEDDHNYTGDYTEFKLRCPQPQAEIDGYIYYPKDDPSSEDIQFLNIWIPADERNKPATGWPVLIFFHGGFLQYGTPNGYDFRGLQGSEEIKNKYIVVSVGYRINVFGFLQSKEILEETGCLNHGLWDQRYAIVWVYKNIHHFGGNPEMITISGLSAGGYSVFFQLAYEVYNPEELQIIKKVWFQSNCVINRQKTVNEAQGQFDELCDKLGIDLKLTGTEKLKILRSQNSSTLVDTITEMDQSFFRAVSDNDFVSTDLFLDILNGSYGKALSKKQVHLTFSETENEGIFYSFIKTPKTMDKLKIQLLNYYPSYVVAEILTQYIKPGISYTESDIKEVYGKICSDFQVYISSRCFLDKIVNSGFPLDNVFRIRTAFRPKYFDAFLKKEYGMTHAFDSRLFFFCKYQGFEDEEAKKTVEFVTPLVDRISFVETKAMEKLNQYWYFAEDGTISMKDDPYWESLLKLGDWIMKLEDR